jgi:uncharacterized protein
LLEHMKRILSLDGGGVRGVFSLQVLERIEQILREKTGRPELVLADYFHFIGGTSTGSIIAAALSWGMSVAKINALYHDQCNKVFSSKNYLRRFWTKYCAEELSQLLREQFSEDGKGRNPVLLNTPKLRTLLLIMMRNGATGAPWPITNNPNAMYNNPDLPDCNLQIPLWRLIRASTAAPTFFPPEEIRLGGKKHIFVDGAITPFNNPSYAMFLAATLPCYKIGWETGVDKLLLVSVGTGRIRVRFRKTEASEINILDQAEHAVLGLIDSCGLYQDFLCRATGYCLAGEPIDSEVGSLIETEGETPWTKQFTYVRYNHEFTNVELRQFAADEHFFSVDNLEGMKLLCEAGRTYAEHHVKSEHLPI